MNNIKPKLNYLIICDAVAQGPDGKKTLYGLFNRIASKKFPCAHPSFSIVTKWSYGSGEYRMKIRIVDSDRKSIFETPNECKFVLNNPLASAEIVLQIQNLVFPKPGTYWIQVILDGVPEEDETAFIVEQG